MRAEHEHGGRDARTAGRGHRSIDVDPGGPEFGRERGAALPGAVVMKESGLRKVARARNVARRDAGAMFGLVAAEAGGCARVDHLLRRDRTRVVWGKGLSVRVGFGCSGVMYRKYIIKLR